MTSGQHPAAGEERRVHPRQPIDPQGSPAIVEIHLPVPKDFSLRREICDLSEGGLSFVMPAEDGFFVPGTPIHEIYVERDGRRGDKSAAVVIYVQERVQAGGLDYKIGLQFTEAHVGTPRLRPATRYQARPPRYGAETLSDVTSLVTVQLPDGTEAVGSLVNFSRYGIAFALEAAANVLSTRDIIEQLSVIVDNEIVFQGSATIIAVTECSGTLEVRASFKSALLEVDDVFVRRQASELRDELTAFFSRLEGVRAGLVSGYRQGVDDLRYVLECTREKLDAVESALQAEPAERRAALEKHILEAVMPHFTRLCGDRLIALNELAAAELTEETDALHRRYFQQQLHPFIMLAPFNWRGYNKPLGYAGDFETVNMLFRDGYEGETLFAKVMHKFSVGLPVAQAHRNRPKFILDTFQGYVASGLTDRRFRVASIGCGPAREAQLWVEGVGREVPTEYILVDLDIKALEYCQEVLLPQAAQHHHRTQWRFLHLTMRQLFRDLHKIEQMRELDVIYVFGLLDYLPDNACRVFLKGLLRLLRQGGLLMFSNVTERNQFRLFMEHGGEWQLYYRSVAHVKGLIEKAVPGQQFRTTTDPTKHNVFAVVEN